MLVAKPAQSNDTPNMKEAVRRRSEVTSTERPSPNSNNGAIASPQRSKPKTIRLCPTPGIKLAMKPAENGLKRPRRADKVSQIES